MANINHIGLIPDGTRRWAKTNSQDLLTAYKISMEKISEFISYSISKGISNVSVYMLSDFNLSRKKEDLEPLIEADVFFIKKILPQLCEELNCTALSAGCLSMLPRYLADAITEVFQETVHYNKHCLYFLFAYNPFDEINYAYKKSASSEIKIEHLWVPEKIDCVIRTAGGPTLLSNFLPLQCSYAQVYMLEKYFNDCRLEDFDLIYEKAKSVKMLCGE